MDATAEELAGKAADKQQKANKRKSDLGEQSQLRVQQEAIARAVKLGRTTLEPGPSGAADSTHEAADSTVDAEPHTGGAAETPIDVAAQVVEPHTDGESLVAPNGAAEPRLEPVPEGMDEAAMNVQVVEAANSPASAEPHMDEAAQAFAI